MSHKNNPQTLVDEKLALNLFLDSLLREPSLETEIETGLDSELQTDVETSTATETRLEAKTTLDSEIPVPEPEIAAQVEAKVESNVETQTEIQQQTEPELQALRPGELPEWSDIFQAMLFKVAGLTLAVPLEELDGVVEYKGPDDLTEMPGSADFYMGILQHQGKSVPVVDTARMVFPPNMLEKLAGDDPAQRVKRIVLIGNASWGLACDEVDEVITLRKEEVRWRSSRTSRRWLLGTVIAQMCALIDTQAFAQKLADGSE